jgi:hypothetical protein
LFLQFAKVSLLLSLFIVGMLRNLGGVGDSKLFEKCLSGSKVLIEEYTQTVARIIKYVSEGNFEDLPIEKKFDFFYEIRQTFGKSALLLSGGVTVLNSTFLAKK